MVDFNRDNTLPRDIVDEMRESYLNYSMSVIVSRALPDVRDGLKPVHRRILYGMSELGSSWNRPYKKSARIVGDVLGKYHPHGDSSVYDALVRMAQDFSMRYELVDGQGNFGSIDGDNAAAMRYTESRMTKLSSEMLKDLDKDTVDWEPNFDETLKEPSVLPSSVPTLLINGSEGIAVGMATKIPPHNLMELVNGIVALIEKPDILTDELMGYIKGPDFPTAGLILGMDGLKEAYETGRGKIKMRARAHIESNKNGKDSIVITEVAYQTNKANLVEKIADLVRDKKVQGITDLRDESDHENPTRLVLVPRSNRVDLEELMLHLFATTDLERSYRVNLNIIGLDGRPQVKDLKVILKEWIQYRTETVRKRLQFRLDNVTSSIHILAGLMIAYLNIDKIIKLIRKEEKPKNILMKNFKLSDIQADAILNLRLRRLAKLEELKIKTDLGNLNKEKKELEAILKSKQH